MFALKSGKAGQRSHEAVAAAPVDALRAAALAASRRCAVCARSTSGEFDAAALRRDACRGAALLGSSVVYGTVVGGHVPAVVAGGHRAHRLRRRRGAGRRQSRDLRDRHPRAARPRRLDLAGRLRRRRGARAHRRAALGRDARRSARSIPTTLEVDASTSASPSRIWQHGSELVAHRARRAASSRRCRGARHADLPLVVGARRRRARGRLRRQDRRLSRARRRACRPMSASPTGAGTCSLDNGITVKLPEHERRAGAGRARRAGHARQQLLSRDIVAVDLRLADRIVVQLTPRRR